MLEFEKLELATKEPVKVGFELEIHKVAADERIPDALFLKILRASHVTNAEAQEATWQPIIDELKSIEANEKI